MDFSGVRAFIFDLDYTLIDSSEGIVHCFNRARKRAGEPEVEPEQLKARIGLPIEDGFRMFGSKDPAAMRELFRRIAREGEMARRSFFLPGALETVAWLHERKYRLAVASTKSRPEIERILEHLGADGYFETVAGSDEVEKPKPAPDSLLLVMERMELEPEQAVYAGDHVVDVRAARAAGLKVIAVKGGPCDPAELSREQPDLLLDDIGAIKNLPLTTARQSGRPR